MTEDDDVQICRAHERIHALNREILLHGDTAAQIAALMRKIAISKARAQDIVSMANQRIAYLNDLWKGGSDAEFSSRESRRSSRISRMKVSDDASMFTESNYETILSQAATILEKISSSTTVPDGSRLESARLAYELRNFTNRLKSSGRNAPSRSLQSRSLSRSSEPSSLTSTVSSSYEPASDLSKNTDSDLKTARPMHADSPQQNLRTAKENTEQTAPKAI
ncbi:hypothetical protein Q1695_009352 [Nippostrongylus brasiliensis]|nr:hypothetical protein Q1695_009352 [Nippostrongylus brasiliensis]